MTVIPVSAVNIGLLRLMWIQHFALMACLAASFGLCLFLIGIRRFARKRSLEHIPTSTVRTANPGPTAIAGIATGPYTLSAPITGRRCYLYQTTVWQRRESGRKQEWNKVAQETLHLPFFIEDFGQLLVEPLGANLDLRQDFYEEYGVSSTQLGPENLPPRVSVFLARHGISPARPTRIEERSIQPETPVFIAGMLMENPGIPLRPFSPDTDNTRRNNIYREATTNSTEPVSPPEIIKLSSGPFPASTMEMSQQSKIAAALTRAGIAKPEPLALAGVPLSTDSAQGVAIEDRAQPNASSAPGARSSGATAGTTDRAPDPTGNRTNDQVDLDTGSRFPSAPPLVLMKGADDEPFVISCHSQPEAVTSLHWKSIASVVAGVGLIMLSLYVLLLARQLR